MERYKKSVMEYRDVQQVVYYARNEARKEALEEGREEGRKEGREKGRKEGIEKGRKEERIKLAKNLYTRNMGMDLITELTGFTKEQIHDIVNNS